MDHQRFDFAPPFRMDYIESVKHGVLNKVPVHDIERREYFLSSLNSLVEYAIDAKKQTQNFSLNVAFFDPNFDPQDEEKIWSKHNIWVKIKVIGGLGLVFRHRYMANQKGVARVDWKRKTYRLAKSFTVNTLLKGAEHALKVTTTLESIGKTPLKTLTQEQEDRSKDRFHKMHYTLDGMMTLLKRMTAVEFSEISEADRFEDLTLRVFELVDVDNDGFLNQTEFVNFFTGLAVVSENYAAKRFDRDAEGSSNMSVEEFTPGFREAMNSITSHNPA